MATTVIYQDGHQLLLTTKTIEWLTQNTTVSVFDPVLFEGYQRKIDEKHCLKIVNYLKTSSFLPSSIICACDVFSDTGQLRIVDGQHRIQAFRMLAGSEPRRYFEIKDQELPIVVMVGVPQETEIETFITINKTSKKVDTSLAFVLKNKLSRGAGDMAMSRAEYIAVEVAQKLNENESEKMWAHRILYEGNVKNSNCYISLNAFVRATRVLVNTLNKIGYISLDWNEHTKQDEVDRIALDMTGLIYHIWETVYMRWPDLYNASFEDKQILQGSIGYTAITRTLVKLIKEKNIHSGDIRSFVSKTILSFGVPSVHWRRQGKFANYSSESGYKIVSDTLIESMNTPL